MRCNAMQCEYVERLSPSWLSERPCVEGMMEELEVFGGKNNNMSKTKPPGRLAGLGLMITYSTQVGLSFQSTTNWGACTLYS